VIDNFLGNNNDTNYEQIINNMLEKYEVLECRMSLKLQSLFSRLDQFPENLGAVSEEKVNGFTKISRRWKGCTRGDGVYP
jgi:hypothetical protein